MEEVEENDPDDEFEKENDKETNYTLLTKKTTKLVLNDFKSIEKLYANNECEKSLNIFSQTNPLRIAFFKLAKSPKFDFFITIILIGSTLHQIMDTFLTTDEENFVFDVIDLIISFIYFFEISIKVIALGFVSDQGSYLSYNWNKLDFFVIVITFIDVWNKIAFLGGASMVEELDFLNYFKLLRNLRTLRLLAKNDNMKKIIASLLDSFLSILKVLGIVFIVYVMFSIIGITLFYKQYNTCYTPVYNDKNIQTGDYMPIPIANFSDYLVQYNITNENKLKFVRIIIILT